MFVNDCLLILNTLKRGVFNATISALTIAAGTIVIARPSGYCNRQCTILTLAAFLICTINAAVNLDSLFRSTAREAAIQRALGASSQDIFRQNVFVTLLCILAGCGLGIGGTEFWWNNTTLDVEKVAGAFASVLILLCPGWRMSQMNPCLHINDSRGMD
jgi:hypothetical protein